MYSPEPGHRGIGSRRLRLLTFSLSGTLFACSNGLMAGQALAQGGSPLPPPPMPTAVNGAPAPASAPAPAGSANATCGGPATANTQDLTVVPGPAEDKRKALLGRIMEAKNQGIGTSTYMMAFDSLEQSVKGGQDEGQVVKRIDSLNSSLDDQFKRGAILKTQRAAPPVAASPASVPLGSGGGPGSSGGGNTDTAALIQKLQSKYGNQIPDNLKDKIPPGDPSSLLKNPQIQDILKGLK